MESHQDDDSLQLDPKFWPRLQRRAEGMKEYGLSQITGGKPDEPVLDQWQHGVMHIIQRPDDEQGILRISIGGGVKGADLDYCVFRGKRQQCLDLLRAAVRALDDRYDVSKCKTS